MKARRLERLPENIRAGIKAGRVERGWSQAQLGEKVGLPQAHISGIETGRVVPRFDTLLEILRVLGRDLVLVPSSLVPVVSSLVREQRNRRAHGVEQEERPLYAVSEDEANNE